MAINPDTELERLSELTSFQILDSPPDPNFDRLTKLASIICNTPVALVSLVDERRQWFLSSVGTEVKETRRCDAFCAHAIEGKELFQIPDARLDSRFAENPLVTGDFSLRFYAGIPLISANGLALGTLCVIDKKPRTLDPTQIEALKGLAEEVMVHLELHRQRLISESAHKQLHEQAELLDKANDAIIVKNLNLEILYWNAGASKLYGWSREEVIGKRFTDFISVQEQYFEPKYSALMLNGEWTGEIKVIKKSGEEFTVEAHCNLVHDEYGNPVSIFSIENDITARKVAETKIHKLAFYDSLTGLPNRQLLLDRLSMAVTNAHRHHCFGALLFIDLDNFKTLNDTLGHAVGDLLLQKVADRLIECVREVDTVGRLGGDEFIVILENLNTKLHSAIMQVETVSHKILETLNKPYDLAGVEHHSTPSIGVTLFDSEGASVEDLLKQADLAMYEAKAQGRNVMCFFDPQMQSIVTNNAIIEADMRQGLKENQFEFYYQPQRGSDRRVTGAEALVRWNHPKRGLIQPAEFIPLAEAIGLIVPLGQKLLELACRQLAIWGQDARTEHITLSVNISVKQLRQPDFINQVTSALKKYKTDPTKLKLELTESSLVDKLEDTIAKMRTLSKMGISFSLDDFGTGYSSLSYLKSLPIDQLKIDQSFIKDLPNDEDDVAIARTILALGENLDLVVIAEGVETPEQEEFLEQNACHEYQGFLFSKPLPIAQFNSFVLTRH